MGEIPIRGEFKLNNLIQCDEYKIWVNLYENMANITKKNAR
jgi:hypothetical protein